MADAYGVRRSTFSRLIMSALDHMTSTSWDGHLSIYTHGLDKYCIYPPVCRTLPGFSYVMGKVVDWNPDAETHWTQYAPK